MEHPDVCCVPAEASSKQPCNLVVSPNAKKRSEGDPLPLVECLDELEKEQLAKEKALDDAFLCETDMASAYCQCLESNDCFSLRPVNPFLGPLVACLASKSLCECMCELKDFKDASRSQVQAWVHETARKGPVKRKRELEDDTKNEASDPNSIIK